MEHNSKTPPNELRNFFVLDAIIGIACGVYCFMRYG